MFSLTRSRLFRWKVLLKGWRVPGATLGLIVTAAALPIAPKLVNLPQLLAAGSYLAPRTVLACLVVSLIALATTDEPCDQVDRTSAVPLRAVRAARMVVMTGLAISALAFGDGALSASTCLAVLTLVGEGLLVAGAGQADTAWLLPTAHLLAAATFGVTADRGVASWAWIIRDSVTPGSLTMSLLLFLGGIYLWAGSA